MTAFRRYDIDGLRAVAVLPVLFYHAAFWPFASGYVGVDVFFVISGYLITALILRESRNGTFTFSDFYDRRIRRILPALTLLLLATCVAAAIILLPDEVFWLTKCLISSALFGVNILYWLKSHDYFQVTAADNPLLHIWSLSVEEQFYFIWPLVLVLFLKSRWRAYLPWLVGGLTILSFVAAVSVSFADPRAAFYLLPTRAWELLLGALLACTKFPYARSQRGSGIAGIVGVILIAWATIAPTTATESFPNWNCCAATIGAVLILYAGEQGAHPVGRLLGSPIPAFIGKISYSLYLWHWPILVFAHLAANRELTSSERGLALFASGLAATLSWWLIEQPIRRRQFRWHDLRVAIPIGIGTSVMIATFGFWVWLEKGLVAWYPPAIQRHYWDAELNFPDKPCEDRRGTAVTLNEDRCVYGDKQHANEILIWGDCYGDTLSESLKAFAAEKHLRLRVVSMQGCPPLPEIYVRYKSGEIRPGCYLRNETTLRALLTTTKTKLVVVDGNWRRPIQLESMSRTSPRHYGRGESRESLAAGLDHLAQKLSSHGYKVLIMGSVPAYHDNPVHCLGRQIRLGSSTDACTRTDREEEEFIDGTIRKIAAKYPNVRAYFPVEALCDGASCRLVADGHLLYKDFAHLSNAGALLIGRQVQQTLRDWDLDTAP